jgi:hypothetical protein
MSARLAPTWVVQLTERPQTLDMHRQVQNKRREVKDYTLHQCPPSAEPSSFLLLVCLCETRDRERRAGLTDPRSVEEHGAFGPPMELGDEGDDGKGECDVEESLGALYVSDCPGGWPATFSPPQISPVPQSAESVDIPTARSTLPIPFQVPNPLGPTTTSLHLRSRSSPYLYPRWSKPSRGRRTLTAPGASNHIP